MSVSNITIPSTCAIIPVDTRTTSTKVLFLPQASSNPGRFLMLKDYYGTAATSSFTISTISNNLIDGIRNTYRFSTTYGSMGLLSDGINSWRILTFYLGNLSSGVAIPGYYTSSSGYMIQKENLTNILSLKLSTNISNTTNIRQYIGYGLCNNTPGRLWTVTPDFDLDSNVYYGMGETERILRKYVLAKGGTTMTSNTIYTLTGVTANMLGSTYAPVCMWSGTGYGAFIQGGFSSRLVYTMEFNSDKSGVQAVYSSIVTTGSVYGVVAIPKAVTGWAYDYVVTNTRPPDLFFYSWTVNMDTRSWTNLTQYTYLSGPGNGQGLIFYPIGLPIFTGDPDTTSNRIGLFGNSTASNFVYTIVQNGTGLTFSFLKAVSVGAQGAFPYSLSQNMYNSIS